MLNKFNQADRSGGGDDKLTPPSLIKSLGHFDLDPCYGHPRPWPTADVMYGSEDHGERIPWFGRVWMNQPYSQAGLWSALMARYGDGVMLVFVRTGTAWFQQHVLRAETASGILFLEGRLQFFQPSGDYVRTKRGQVSNAGAPSCLVSYDRAKGPGALTPNFDSLHACLASGLYKGTVLPLVR